MARFRITTLVALFAVCLITITIYTSTNTSTLPTPEGAVTGDDEAKAPSSFKDNLPSFETPNIRFSWRTSAHRPPEQQNSTSGDTKWFSDWKWLNPFSSSITLDENRSVLPPLRTRTPVYTYYDTTVEMDKEEKQTDQELLLTWRRAWWAYGFRPVILSSADALSNPLYETLRAKKLEPDMDFEILRFLAWGKMGTGLLASYDCFPMGDYDDDLLAYLRRGDYPELTRFETLGAGLFAGPKNLIEDATKDAIEKANTKEFASILEAIPSERFRVEQPTSIASYDSNTITVKYPSLAQKLVETPKIGRRALNELINSHLHITWQNSFRKGIAVLKPLPKHTTALVEPAAQLADLLAECPKSPVPASCPPNHPKCSPCVANKVAITTRATYLNTSEEFTIGTVPHPYTILMLNNQSDIITVPHIRRYTERDPWLVAATKGLLGTSRGGPSRVVGLKDAVASNYGLSRGIWLTAEQMPPYISMESEDGSTAPEKTHYLPEEFLADLDWSFGFSIPRGFISKGESVTPVPGPERRPKSQPGLPVPKRKSWDVDPPTELEFGKEVELMSKARDVIKSTKSSVQTKEVAEMWNLADTEAWRFVRAWRARSTMERAKWEEEEKGYGVDGSVKASSRWFT